MRFTAILLASLLTSSAIAQTVPNPQTPIANGQTWSVSQWLAAWQSKVDVNAGTLVNPNITGGTVTGVAAVLSTGPITAGTVFVIPKLTVAPVVAPGAGVVWLFAVAGTASGTCKIEAMAGTSTTPALVTDNIGGGC
jgi:hypothetical protein